jgi:hypothetical protein
MRQDRHWQPLAVSGCLAEAVAKIVCILRAVRGDPGEWWCMKPSIEVTVMNGKWRMERADMVPQNSWREVSSV